MTSTLSRFLALGAFAAFTATSCAQTESDTAIYMLNTLPISEQAIDDFLPVMQNNAQNSREEEGNITFEVFMNEDGSSTIYLFEEWESAEALEEHMETPHLQAVAAVVGDAFVEGQRETSLRLNRLTDDTPPAPVSTPGRNAKCSGHFRCEA